VTAISTPQPTVTIMPGRWVYEAQSCAVCHTINGEGGSVGPDLSRVGAERDHGWLRQFLADPKSLVTGATMPAYGQLSHQDLDALVDYMMSLR
jgi:cbb3-type cytochrome oxidase cytochrome c subunit